MREAGCLSAEFFPTKSSSSALEDFHLRLIRALEIRTNCATKNPRSIHDAFVSFPDRVFPRRGVTLPRLGCPTNRRERKQRRGTRCTLGGHFVVIPSFFDP
jgi:hypothetical protein